MKKPDQKTIDSWISVSERMITKVKKYLADKWYQQQDIPEQVTCHVLGLYYACLGRAKAINNQDLKEVRSSFSEASKNILQSFEMAYDVNSPKYIGNKPKRNDQMDAGYGQVDWPSVNETYTIDGFNWALMGKDFTTAESIASWYQDRPDGVQMDPDVNRYVYAYKYMLLNQPQNALPLLNATVDLYNTMPPKTTGDMNYFLMSIIMQGIALNDSNQVNESLLMYLDFYLRAIIPAEDLWDTDEEFIADAAVALANLAIHRGIEIRIQHDLLPQQLIR